MNPSASWRRCATWSHTYGGEFSLQGGVEKPDHAHERAHQARVGAWLARRAAGDGRQGVGVRAALRPQGAQHGLPLRLLIGYAAPDLTVLAEHVTEGGGVTSMAYQQEPDLVLGPCAATAPCSAARSTATSR